MRPDEEPAVRALAIACHPDAKLKPASWYFAYPTLVAYDVDEAAIVGYMQYSMNLDDRVGLMSYGQDLGVAAEARGRGVAVALVAVRLRIARELGAIGAVCTVEPSNAPMLRVLDKLGWRYMATVPRLFEQYDPPRTGMVYTIFFQERS